MCTSSFSIATELLSLECEYGELDGLESSAARRFVADPWGLPPLGVAEGEGAAGVISWLDSSEFLTDWPLGKRRTSGPLFG
jgi:hypothetical protein